MVEKRLVTADMPEAWKIQVFIGEKNVTHRTMAAELAAEPNTPVRGVVTLAVEDGRKNRFILDPKTDQVKQTSKTYDNVWWRLTEDEKTEP